MQRDNAQGKEKNLVGSSCSVSACPCLNIQTCNHRTKKSYFFFQAKLNKHWQSMSKQEWSHTAIYWTETTEHSVQVKMPAKLGCSKLDCQWKLQTCLTLGPPAPPNRLARPEALPPPSEPPNSWWKTDDDKKHIVQRFIPQHLHELLLWHVVEQVLQFRVSKVVEIQA